MYPWKVDYSSRQKNTSAGTNACKYIILHHTATGYDTLNGNLKVLLGETDRKVSAHVLIDTNGDAYKLADPKKITWHAGESAWQGFTNLNTCSIGIEVIGPLPKVGFTDEQRHTVYWLVGHLMAALNIPKENVIRHKDIAPGRKTDIADALWGDKYNTFDAWRNTLKPKLFT